MNFFEKCQLLSIWGLFLFFFKNPNNLGQCTDFPWVQLVLFCGAVNGNLTTAEIKSKNRPLMHLWIYADCKCWVKERQIQLEDRDYVFWLAENHLDWMDRTKPLFLFSLCPQTGCHRYTMSCFPSGCHVSPQRNTMSHENNTAYECPKLVTFSQYPQYDLMHIVCTNKGIYIYIKMWIIMREC